VKKGSGKRKGSQFERDIARMLDVYWKVPKNTFWRTPNSGGWHEAGDVYARDSSVKFPFIVECKNYKSFDLLQYLSRPETTKIYKWWNQVLRDSINAVTNGRDEILSIPLLIMKINNFPIFVAYNIHNLPNNYSKGIKDIDFPFFDLGMPILDLKICLLSDFMEYFTKEIVMEHL
jgi:Holliday junction resolvase